MPTTRESMAGAVLDGRLHVVAGATAPETFTWVHEVYDPSFPGWTTKEPLPTGEERSGAAAAVVGGRLYVFGGRNGGGYLDTAWVYDPAFDAWSPVGAMPRKRGWGAAVELDGLVYLAGGQDASGVVLEVDVYDPVADAWAGDGERPAALTSGRASAAAVSFGGLLYVAGGSNGASFQAGVVADDPAGDAWSDVASMNQNRLGHLLVATEDRLLAVGGHSGSPGASSIVASVEKYVLGDGEEEGDATPPTIHGVEASPDTLWPPNNQMVDVTITVDAEDDGQGAVACRIVSVTNDEAEGDDADWDVTGDLALELRAQRDGSGDGRTYTVTVECTDEAGNTSRQWVLRPVTGSE